MHHKIFNIHHKVFVYTSQNFEYKSKEFEYTSQDIAHTSQDFRIKQRLHAIAEILGFLIRNNKDIKGITIEGLEQKLSQYADDKTIFTDGSQISLDGIIRILDFFATL